MLAGCLLDALREACYLENSDHHGTVQRSVAGKYFRILDVFASAASTAILRKFIETRGGERTAAGLSVYQSSWTACADTRMKYAAV